MKQFYEQLRHIPEKFPINELISLKVKYLYMKSIGYEMHFLGGLAIWMKTYPPFGPHVSLKKIASL